MADQEPRKITGFDPSRFLTLVSGKEYLEVKWRLVWLRSEHPDAIIRTTLLSHEQKTAVCHATITIPDGGSAEGLGMEDAQGFGDYLEKAETKAIGRALAALGYGTQFCGDFEFGAAAGRVVDAPVQGRSPAIVVRDNPQVQYNPPQQQAPRQQYGQQAGNPATDKQMGMIRGIAKEQNLAGPDLDAIIADVTGGTINDLTTRSASTVIDRLRSGSGQRPQQQAPRQQYPQNGGYQQGSGGMRNPDAPASQKQKDLIAAKWRKKFSEESDFELSKNNWLASHFGTDWASMTMQQAHDFIEAFSDPDMTPM